MQKKNQFFLTIIDLFSYFSRSSETWHSVGESEARQIYFPTLKALNAKNVQEVKPYGRYDTGYSLSKEFIFTLINPKCDNRLFVYL